MYIFNKNQEAIVPVKSIKTKVKPFSNLEENTMIITGIYLYDLYDLYYI